MYKIFVPGLGTKKKVQKRLYPDFFDVIFDYRTQGIRKDKEVFPSDIANIETDRVKRLVKLIEGINKPIALYAHSHGVLLVSNALEKLGKRDLGKIKEIHAYGGGILIPVMNKMKIVNYFNRKDLVYQNAMMKMTYSRSPSMQKSLLRILKSPKNIHVIQNATVKYKVVFIPGTNITEYDPYTNDVRVRKCNVKGIDPHMISCYKHLFTR